VHLLKFRPNKLAEIARKNRQEIIKAKLSRRDLFKMGLLTGSGYLVVKSGLSARAPQACGPTDCRPGCSPFVQPFQEPLPIMPVLPERDVNTYPEFVSRPPNDTPNSAINPANNLPFEGRTETHQSRGQFPPQKFLITRMAQNSNVIVHPALPPQTLWGFNLGDNNFTTDPALSPGPTVVTRYGSPVLIRRYNQLPPEPAFGGFGVPEVSTHLHNFHSGPDSDGGPCDPDQQRFFFREQYYDYFHNLARAGFGSTHPPNGDVNETLSTLWYHDHRVDHTAENVYKGMAGFLIAFSDGFDTGDEGTGFHLPSFFPFPSFDIPIILTDKLFNPGSGQLCFDTFGLDGLVGDTFLVNGKVQPFMDVFKRRYRFRVLDGGPSRFYQFFLTNPDNLNQQIPFWVISNDGNLLPTPLQVTSVLISVAERFDIIVDFKKIAQDFGATRLRLENRLVQVNGRGPTGQLFSAGQGNQLVEFRLGAIVTDNSVDPATGPQFFTLPTKPRSEARVTREFQFERRNGQWAINGQFVDCNNPRFRVKRNTAEIWVLENFQTDSLGWQHPIHIHMEEFQMLSRQFGAQPPPVERSRKDVVRLGRNERIELFFRFRDFLGVYPMHCHNTIHEDHAMMLLWEVDDVGDTIRRP